jgi:SAM-dependent methyltransferase
MSTSAETLEEVRRLINARRVPDAVALLARELATSPGDVPMAIAHAALCLDLGQADVALATLETAAQHGGGGAGAPEAFELQGMALARTGHATDAVAAFRRMFRTDEGYAERRAREFMANCTQGNGGRFWRAPPTMFGGEREPARVFETIYAQSIWGGGSGAGSDLERAAVYVALVQHLLETRAIRRVVDLGCGDWRFARHIDWSGVEYFGYDVVPSVIANNQAHYGASNVQFGLADVTDMKIEACDLLLCKDVLQHLDNSRVAGVLRNLANARYWLVANDFHPVNFDCLTGDTRPINITAAPFAVDARPLAAWDGKVAFLGCSEEVHNRSQSFTQS